MKEKWCRFRDSIGLWFKRIINTHKWWLIVFCVVFLISFITGIMTCVNYFDVVSYENIINKHLSDLLIGEKTYISFFLIMCLWFLVIFFFLIWFTKNIFFVVVDFILLSLMAYIWGFDICIIVMTLGFAGVIYGIIVLGVLGIIIFLNITIILSLVCKKFFEFRNNCSNEIMREYFWQYFILVILGILTLFIMSLLFSSIRIFVIVD